jgi:Holliday junction resolvase RusA-like endonuclease
LKPSALNFPQQKDNDNLTKFLMDAMEGIMYLNDKVINELHAKKEYLIKIVIDWIIINIIQN